ncbi:hypothetical protein MNBD_ALPHA06-2279 [hydrothermal vent metagenome]|uniref:Uncharacterized protein n=1 Tax=hydrothermal vent metagenome TaxID=652676 RepID=A0A3B0RRA0_9ZZZZ
MSLMDRRLARLEEEGAMMVTLENMSEADLRTKLNALFTNAEVLRQQLPDLSLEVLAEKLADCRGEMGIFMRECEVRSSK